jgi:hypothetical protein
MPKAPSDVERLVALANLWGRTEPIHAADPVLRGETDDLVAAAKRAVQGLPAELRRFIGPITWRSRAAFLARWDQAYRARILMDAAVRSFEIPVDLGVAIPGSVRLQMDPQRGTYTVVLAEELAALQGVDARIARCKECSDFVWMQRRRARPFCPKSRCRQAAWRRANPLAEIENEMRRAAKERSQ